MFTKLSDRSKAAIFTVLVMILAVGAALLIRMQDHFPGPGLWTVWMLTPTMATLIMVLVVTREGYSKEGWKSLGLHRLGLNVWWIAFGVTSLITVAATAIVWATPLASFVMPEGGIVGTLIDFLFKVVMFTLFFSLGEEIGWRGYLLPKLLSLGRTRALLLVGLIWAPWHLVLFFLTPFFPMGNVLIFLPLFVGTIVAASFFFGYLRLYTGSVWPASIGHSVHNAAWGALGALTATSSPVLVNLYLVGDNGILILVATALGAIWVGYMLRSGMNKAQPIGAAPEMTAREATPAAPR
jgi:membrane protease YdiL (CAAX protease family)